MTYRQLGLHLFSIAKPKFREPCNGCGLCCKLQVCEAGKLFLGTTSTPCPALEYESNRYWCGLVRRPHHYLGITFAEADTILSPGFYTLIAGGQGCGMEDEVKS